MSEESAPDLREAMAGAGFRDVHFLWEATDLSTGEGNGVFRRKEKGDPDELGDPVGAGAEVAGPDVLAREEGDEALLWA